MHVRCPYISGAFTMWLLLCHQSSVCNSLPLAFWDTFSASPHAFQGQDVPPRFLQQNMATNQFPRVDFELINKMEQERRALDHSSKDLLPEENLRFQSIPQDHRAITSKDLARISDAAVADALRFVHMDIPLPDEPPGLATSFNFRDFKQQSSDESFPDNSILLEVEESLGSQHSGSSGKERLRDGQFYRPDPYFHPPPPPPPPRPPPPPIYQPKETHSDSSS